MFIRALSSRRSTSGYEKLGGDNDVVLDPKLNRSRTLPAKVLGSLSTIIESKTSTTTPAAKTAVKQAKKVSKIHPLFSIFETKRKKKATANPEFSRYVEYLKEGGLRTWDMKPSMPVVYHR